MIENIHLESEGSYDANGAQLDGLKDVNFIFGSNGAGKTTISRVIHDISSRPDCRIAWKNGAALDTRVYNRDFVRDHFDEHSDIKGIYTFGENVEVAKEIERLGAQMSSQNGARAWAGGRPNLVNVAVTRAKASLYVIGNRQLWKSAGVFAVLDRYL